MWGSVGKGGGGMREWEGVSVLPAGLVYHKPPSCQYYDRSEMDTVSFAQSVLGVDDTVAKRRGKGQEGLTLLVLRTRECQWREDGCGSRQCHGSRRVGGHQVWGSVTGVGA